MGRHRAQRAGRFERADTWERTEALVENDLTGKSPYQEAPDGTFEGNVTFGNHTANLAHIPDPSLRPSMDDPATRLSDSGIRKDVAASGVSDLARRRTSERISMLRRLARGATLNDDEAKEGLNKVQWQLDFGDQDRVDDLYGGGE